MRRHQQALIVLALFARKINSLIPSIAAVSHPTYTSGLEGKQLVAFLTFIHQFSDMSIMFGVLLFAVTVVGVAPFFGRTILRLSWSEERYAAAIEGFKGITSVLGVLIAFSLVQANGNVRVAEEQVAREGALSQTIDRILLRSDRPELIAMRPLVNDYLTARVEKEWPALARGDRSPDADHAYSVLSKAVRSLKGEDLKQQAVLSELLKALDDLSDVRELTISESDPDAFSLGTFYWTAILIFCGIAVLLAVFTRPSLAAIALPTAIAAAVALMLSMLMIVDLPFQGDTSVSNDPLARAIDVNARRV